MKITLCGSTKFKDEYLEWNKRLTLRGHVVYSVAMWAHADHLDPTDDQKRRLDLVHLFKIDESDAIVVLNVGGYIGDSTLREIEWARLKNKDVFWLDLAQAADCGPLDVDLAFLEDAA